jgi:hypothetical protein
MLALHEWQNFYMLTGTVAATLIGLLVVAVSISLGTNLSLKQATNAFRTFVDPTLLYYVQALVVSCLAVMPLSSPWILSVAASVLGGISLFLPGKVFWRILVLHRDETIDVGHWIWHVMLPLLGGLLYLGTAIGLLAGLPLALVGLSIADLLCLSIGLHNTWALTSWLILRRDGWDQALNEQQTIQRDAIHQ